MSACLSISIVNISITHWYISIRQPIITAPLRPFLCAEIIFNPPLLRFGAFCKWVRLPVFPAPYDNFFYFLKRANSITRLGRHIRQPKATGETLISTQSLKSPIKTKDAVKQVLEQIPQARYNEGLLAERVLRYFQPQGVEMHYDKNTQEITLKAPKALMLAVLRHIETIARRSREYREVHPFAERPKAQERKVEYDFSTKEWAEKSEGDWLAWGICSKTCLTASFVFMGDFRLIVELRVSPVALGCLMCLPSLVMLFALLRK